MNNREIDRLGSRPIKFRAWCEKYTGWLYAELHHPNGWSFSTPPDHPVDGPCGAIHRDWKEFTGLHDKNGREIYEGDIAKITFTESSERWTELGIMCWVGKSAQFRFEIDGDELTREVSDPFIVIEVIGNVYENCDLLKNA